MSGDVSTFQNSKSELSLIVCFDTIVMMPLLFFLLKIPARRGLYVLTLAGDQIICETSILAKRSINQALVNNKYKIWN